MAATSRRASAGATPSNGSSSSSRRRPHISARASATSFCCPPESWSARRGRELPHLRQDAVDELEPLRRVRVIGSPIPEPARSPARSAPAPGADPRACSRCRGRPAPAAAWRASRRRGRSIVPARIGSRPMIARISVVLPAPLRPTSPTNEPGAIESRHRSAPARRRSRPKAR